MNGIYQYHQEGQLYLWRYFNERNYPGYHMAWAGMGRQNFIEFLRCLAVSENAAYRTLNLFKPTADILHVPNNKNSKIIHLKKLRIELDNDFEWNFNAVESNGYLKLSPESCLRLASICEKVRAQDELNYQEWSFWW